MRNKDVIKYLGLWEEINNSNFKRVEFDTFKNETGFNSFSISPDKWINNTNANGMVSKSGKYNSVTFAHPDIVFEFASWLSPEFKLYLIKEFERLKFKEMSEVNIEWNFARLFTKINYFIQYANNLQKITFLFSILVIERREYVYI